MTVRELIQHLTDLGESAQDKEITIPDGSGFGVPETITKISTVIHKNKDVIHLTPYRLN